MKLYKKTNSIKNFTQLFALAIIISGVAFVAFAAPPANDNFANAEVVNGIQVHITRTNVEATKEANEANHANNPGGKSVWFKWTALMTRVMSFTTNRSAGNLNTLLNVYAVNAQSNLQSVTFNNDINNHLSDMNTVEAMEFIRNQMHGTISNEEFLISMNG